MRPARYLYHVYSEVERPAVCAGAKPFMDNLAAAYATLDLHQGLTTTRLAELVRHLCRYDK